MKRNTTDRDEEYEIEFSLVGNEETEDFRVSIEEEGKLKLKEEI